jgi:hypothetical protein
VRLACLVASLGLSIPLLGASAAFAAVAAPAVPAAPPSGYVPMSALINGDSITNDDGITDGSGNPISLEQFAAQQAGYNVTVVTGTQWDAMTAADFAKYQLLIVGDPDCSTTPVSATSNAGTWAPVVMGTSGLNSTVGNRVAVGTDPEYHYLNGGGGAAPTNPSDPTTAGAEHLVQDGITYAGGVSGGTGMYFDTSCDDNGSIVPVLNSLSAVGSGFTEDASPPCGGSVQLIASNPVFSSLTDTDIQGWECSDHITFPTYPTDWQPLAVATDTSSHPTCGTDPNTGTTACGEAYVLVAGEGIVVTAPDLTLTPSSGSDPVGGTHTVTATVTQSGAAVSGQTVSFDVTGQNAGVTGTCVPASCQTDASGKVTFTYSDANGAGTDTINASVTIGGTTEHATATETWTVTKAATTTTTSLTGGGQTGTSITVPAGTAVTDAATLSGANTATASGTVTYNVYSDSSCTTPAGAGGTETVTNGLVPSSNAVTFTAAGTYYWTASYSGDDNNASSASGCGSEKVVVTAGSHTAPAIDDSCTALHTGSATINPGLDTTKRGDLLVAYATADGPKSGGQSLTVSGLGLTWTKVARENAQPGDAEVWTATAPGLLSDGKVTAKAALKGYYVYLTVVAYKNASGIGAAGTFAAPSGAPTGTVTTTQDHSWVWGVGFDWTAAVNRKLGPGQTMFQQTKDPASDTDWVQYVTAPVPVPGTSVTLSDTAPIKDRYNLVVVEIL